MTLRGKLYFAGGSVTIAAMLMGGFSLWMSYRLGAALTTAVTSTSVKLDLTNAMRQRVQEMAASERAAWIEWSSGRPEQAQAMTEKFRKAAGRTHEQVAEIQPLLTIEANRRGLAEIEGVIRNWERSAARVFELCASQQTPQALDLMRAETDTAIRSIETVAAAVVAAERAALKVDRDNAASARRLSLLMNLMLGVIVIASAAFGLWSALGACRVLNGFVETLRQQASALASASGQLSSSSQALAGSASQQASSIEETSASSEEIRSMAENNTQHSEAASAQMDSASLLIDAGTRSLAHLGEWVHGVRDSGQKISKIIRVIDEIAFQTNILALNAAVEAARAGEAGMGFAVVAEEVRNLAQRCARAAQETTSLIEETVTRAGEGEQRLAELSSNITELTPTAQSTRERLDEVRQASREQTKGLAQIGSAMSRLEQLTQQVAAGAEECAAASEELAGQAASMGPVVDGLHRMAG
jgi:methyl-accepting chemotaxis protein/methyl-accepting chemotaxis protein-1 (serine sensor receptor)